MSTRRKRSDSASAAMEATQAALVRFDPPSFVSLHDGARPFWDAIVETKHKDSWTPNDLIVAANLANINFEIDKYTRVIEKASRLTKEDVGYRVSALHKVLIDLVAQSQSLARALQVHARATQGESTFQVKRNTLYREAAQSVDALDDLIARPSVTH